MPFVCEKCGAVLVSEYALNLHNAIHHGVETPSQLAQHVPSKPWTLTESDKEFLKINRIDPET